MCARFETFGGAIVVARSAVFDVIAVVAVRFMAIAAVLFVAVAVGVDNLIFTEGGRVWVEACDVRSFTPAIVGRIGRQIGARR